MNILESILKFYINKEDLLGEQSEFTNIDNDFSEKYFIEILESRLEQIINIFNKDYNIGSYTTTYQRVIIPFGPHKLKLLDIVNKLTKYSHSTKIHNILIEKCDVFTIFGVKTFFFIIYYY